MVRKLFIISSLLFVGLTGYAEASTILRCEGKATTKFFESYKPKYYETCINHLDTCVADFVDYWIIDGDQAHGVSLPGNYKKDQFLVEDIATGWNMFVLDNGSQRLLINTISGEYEWSASNEKFEYERNGFCERVKDKKLF